MSYKIFGKYIELIFIYDFKVKKGNILQFNNYEVKFLEGYYFGNGSKIFLD